MSWDPPSDDYDNFDFDKEYAHLTNDQLRALELVKRFESRTRAYFESLAIFRMMRSNKRLKNLELPQDLSSDRYNPVRPFKIEVVTRSGTRKMIGAWNLCATLFDGIPTWVHVDANTGETYMAQRQGDNDTTPPMPLAAEELAYQVQDLNEVKHLVDELERQGKSLSFMAAEVGEG